MFRPKHGGNLAWAAQIAGCSPELILDFSASINPLGIPQRVIEAIQANLSAIQHYPDPSYQRLRQFLADWHQVPIEYVLVGNGASELITWAARELAKLSWVGLIVPAFRDYWRSLRAFDAQVIPINLQLSVASPAIKRRETDLPQMPPSSRHSAGLLLNNPHNPTGVMWSREILLSLLQDFALVVVDESFMDFLPPAQDQSFIPWVTRYPNLVVIRSLTKFYSLPGLRLGYAIAHTEHLNQWQQWRDPWPVNVLAEAAAITALGDQQFRQETWAWLEPARETLYRGIATVPQLQPYRSSVNFLLVKSDQSILPWQEKLLKNYQIFIRDCLSFPELGENFFRVAVRTPQENQKLLAAIAHISTDSD